VVCATIYVEHEHPYKAIIDTAGSRSCDLIVMAFAHRRGVAAILTTITPSYKGVTPPPASATSGETSDAGTMVVVLVGIFFIVLIFVIIIQIVRALRYGYLVLREGPTAARKDMRNWPAYGAVVLGGGGFSSGGDSGGGGFSAGGGDFGGGGASGSW